MPLHYGVCFLQDISQVLSDIEGNDVGILFLPSSLAYE